MSATESARGEREVGAPAELDHDDLRHGELVIAAEDLRRHVVADAQHEGQERAGDDRPAE